MENGCSWCLRPQTPGLLVQNTGPSARKQWTFSRKTVDFLTENSGILPANLAGNGRKPVGFQDISPGERPKTWLQCRAENGCGLRKKPVCSLFVCLSGVSACICSKEKRGAGRRKIRLPVSFACCFPLSLSPRMQ